MEAAPSVAGNAVVFPGPRDKDFEDDIGDEERKYYINKFKDLNSVKNARLHCTACDRHLGCAAKSDCRMRTHPMLRTLVCRTCYTFYNSGEFERGDDGSELYCRWCGQGGQVYCCSSCPHVFCAKCVKRNMGAEKIREIESLDDWKCFKCHPRDLWDLRAACWALLRYCDYKNKLAYSTEDAELKEKYQKDCTIDESDCCKHKKRTSTITRKKEEKEAEDSKDAIIAKIPSGIQVKKFATVNIDNILRAGEKKGIKRPASPIRPKSVGIRAPIPIAPFPRPSAMMQPLQQRMNPPKKMKSPSILMNHMMEPRKQYSPRPSRPRFPAIQYPQVNMSPMNTLPIQSAAHSSHFNNYNGYGNFVNSDNINLSLENLTHGLDMASVATMTSLQNDDVVCTPDFPIEPVCEVTEDNPDDDVECITPGPVVQPKPPLAPQRSMRNLPDLTPENIVQMTENDVTVNAVTGGLKFRVDPQTLSSNKMYRLPDGRIFAINSNPNMPGGYSATIVAVSDAASGSIPSAAPLRGTTYAANLSTVVSSANSPPPLVKLPKNSRKSKDNKPHTSHLEENSKKKRRNPDMKTPIEWYRYNLIDAVDALEYSLSRLQRLKKETDSRHLRTRTVPEMRALHLQLEGHLHTSSTRFQEIKENLNRGLKSYLKKKGKPLSEEEEEDDDDDVEILPDDPPKHDDPIFIDENSLELTGEVSDDEVLALNNSVPDDSSEQSKSNDMTKHVSNAEQSEMEAIKISASKRKSNNKEVKKISKTKEQQSDEQVPDGSSGPDSVETSSARCDSEIVENLDKHSQENLTDEIIPINNDSAESGEHIEQLTENVQSNDDSQVNPVVNNGQEGTDKEKLFDELDKPKADAEEKKENHEPSAEAQIPEGLDVSEIDESLFKNEKSKFNGGNGGVNVEEMDVDEDNSETQILGKNGDNDLQMSDEMIDNLLADDIASDSLAADQHKLTDGSLDSLPDTDLMNSHFN